MSEDDDPVTDDMVKALWEDAAAEYDRNQARRASMAWAVDKLRKLKRNCEYLAATCEEIAQALSADNPKLATHPHPEPPDSDLPQCCYREMSHEGGAKWYCQTCGKVKLIPVKKGWE